MLVFLKLPFKNMLMFGDKVGEEFKLITKFGDKIVTTFGDKFGVTQSCWQTSVITEFDAKYGDNYVTVTITVTVVQKWSTNF